jgi:hypothetical protein
MAEKAASDAPLSEEQSALVQQIFAQVALRMLSSLYSLSTLCMTFLFSLPSFSLISICH